MSNPRDAERRDRFKAWWRTTFGGDYPQGNARFIKLTGYTKGTSSHLWDDDKPFGEKRAREVALRCHLDETAFQIAPTAPHSGRPAKPTAAGFPTRGQTLGEQYDLLTPEEQWRFEHLLAAALDQPPPMGEPFKWERRGNAPAPRAVRSGDGKTKASAKTAAKTRRAR